MKAIPATIFFSHVITSTSLSPNIYHEKKLNFIQKQEYRKSIMRPRHVLQPVANISERSHFHPFPLRAQTMYSGTSSDHPVNLHRAIDCAKIPGECSLEEINQIIGGKLS